MQKTKFNTVYNRKNKLNPQGKGLIQIECYLNGRKKYFSTNIYLEPQYWNYKTKTIKIDFANGIKLNKQISETLRNLENFELDLINQNKPFSLSMLDDFFKPKQKFNFTDFCENEINNCNYKNATKNNQRSTLKRLKQFKNEIEFNEITFEFLHDFNRFCEKQTLSFDGKNTKKLSHNTIYKYFSNIKIFVNLAINKNLMSYENYPFRKFKIKLKQVEKSFLTPAEIILFEDVELTGENKKYQYVKDLFLFATYTGLRYSDVISLQKTDFETIDGNKHLVKKMEKTGDTVRIPIMQIFDGKPNEIINKYFNFKSIFCFEHLSNQHINNYLLKICELAGITKKVTFHTARHTTATYLLYKGISITTVQKILGHKNLATTQIYGHIMDETITKELKAVNW
ncbi:site-specific integrase [Flavobacterium branchiophilum]|uniref:Recombinase n=1 Tax=Flavobacterium branchiophilum TaxID=55197 RepID=A0A2H3KAF1_9FLAO|nr:site-specific integrase [Flavobacterium branchiophilum]PDS23550.1 recombinase [Flavobacterium branchiophilum]